MPRIPNKIIINCSTFDADSYAMQAAFNAVDTLGEEMKQEGGGKLKGNTILAEDAALHLAEQESICHDLDAAMADCIARQRALNDKRRKWFDTQL